MCLPYLIQGHSVHFDGLRIFLLSGADIAHVHPESPSIVEHLVLHDEQVGVEGLRVHLVSLVLVSQVEQNLYTHVKTTTS